jgi:hypothetical protein
MRPATLAQAYERIIAGEPREKALSEFLDAFYLALTPGAQLGALLEEAPLTGDPRLDALAGAVAEYLARQYDLPSVPAWVFAPQRYLDRAWHVCPIDTPGMREYLSYASPAEFRSRNIFTEERPLHRARSHLPLATRNSVPADSA